MITILYRYIGYNRYDLDHPSEFRILKETDMGWWIATGYYFGRKEYTGPKRWVSKTGKKRFAYPTKEEAMTNYIARKNSQIKHCKRMIELARQGYHIAKNTIKKEII